AGQLRADAFALASGNDQVVAVGVNCCLPGDADRAVEVAAEVSGKPVAVYPNSGESWDAAARGRARGPSPPRGAVPGAWPPAAGAAAPPSTRLGYGTGSAAVPGSSAAAAVSAPR